MNKKILGLGTIIGTTIPVMISTSCSTVERINNKKYNAPIHEYLFEKNIQDSTSRAHLNFGGLTRERLTQLPKDMSGYYNKDIVASGFGELRKYYLDGKKVTVHVGLDIMRPKNSKVFAPFNGEILANYWRNSDGEFAAGIGGVIIMRTLISQLHIPESYKKFIYLKKTCKVRKGRDLLDVFKVWKVPRMAFIHSGVFHAPDSKTSKIKMATITEYNEHIKTLSNSEKISQLDEEKYIKVSFMHLSKSSVSMFRGRDAIKQFDYFYKPTNTNYHTRYNTTIDFKHTYQIKRGQLMGYIGGQNENGGWQSHTHIEATCYSPTIEAKFKYSKLKEYRAASSDKNYKAPTKTIYYKKNHFNISSYKDAKPMGTYLTSNPNWYKSKRWNFESMQYDHAIIDPNNIFEIYNDKTPKIVV